MLTVAFWAAGFGLLTATVGGTDTGSAPVASVAFALLLAPPTFAVASFMSRRDDAPTGVIIGMVVSLVVGGIVVVVLGNVLTALIAGHAGAAAVTLATDAGTSRARRAAAVAAVVVVVAVGFAVAPLPAAFIAPGLPYTAIGVADEGASLVGTRADAEDEGRAEGERDAEDGGHGA